MYTHTNCAYISMSTNTHLSAYIHTNISINIYIYLKLAYYPSPLCFHAAFLLVAWNDRTCFHGGVESRGERQRAAAGSVLSTSAPPWRIDSCLPRRVHDCTIMEPLQLRSGGLTHTRPARTLAGSAASRRPFISRARVPPVCVCTVDNKGPLGSRRAMFLHYNLMDVKWKRGTDKKMPSIRPPPPPPPPHLERQLTIIPTVGERLIHVH